MGLAASVFGWRTRSNAHGSAASTWALTPRTTTPCGATARRRPTSSAHKLFSFAYLSATGADDHLALPGEVARSAGEGAFALARSPSPQPSPPGEGVAPSAAHFATLW